MNRRRQYRVTADFDKLVKLELIGPKVHARDVRLLDLSSGGCGVELPETANGMLLNNDLVDLKVISHSLAETVDMRGRVAWLDERAARPQIGMTFVNWREHRALLDSNLKSLFNEREAFRVQPDARHPVSVEVQLEGEAKSINARLRDISLLGLGLTVPVEHMKKVRARGTLVTKFILPESDVTIAVESEVRHVRADLDAPRAHIGLRMNDVERLSAPATRAIRTFVMARQRELCRMGIRQVA
jgi:c-di-GMP-binding flagellar brake protein YcgR